MIRLFAFAALVGTVLPPASAADPPKGSAADPLKAPAAGQPKGALVNVSEERFLVYYVEDLYRDTFPKWEDKESKPLYAGQETKRLVSTQRGYADKVKAYVKSQKGSDARLVELCDDYKELLGEADVFADKQLKREKAYLVQFEKLREEFRLALLKANMKAKANLLNTLANDQIHLATNSWVAASVSRHFSLTSFGFGYSRAGRDPYMMAHAWLFSGLARTTAAELNLAVRQITLFEQFEKRAEKLEREEKPKLIADLQANTDKFLPEFATKRAEKIQAADKLVRGMGHDSQWDKELATFEPEPAGGAFPAAVRKANPFVPMRELLAAKPPTKDKELTAYVALARDALTAAEGVPDPKGRTNESVALFKAPAARMAATAGLAANCAGFLEMGDSGWKGAKVPSADPDLPALAWAAYEKLDTRAALVPKDYVAYQKAIAKAHRGGYVGAFEEMEKITSPVCKMNPEFCYYAARLAALRGEHTDKSLAWLDHASKLGYPRIADAASCPDLDRVRKDKPKKFEEIVSRR